MTQSDMNQCAALELNSADSEINATYKEFRDSLSKEQREQPRQVQLAWINFKQQHCEFEASFVEGGSMQPLIRDSCLTQMTQQRTLELRVTQEIFSY